jgi:hypothetical protein
MVFLEAAHQDSLYAECLPRLPYLTCGTFLAVIPSGLNPIGLFNWSETANHFTWACLMKWTVR